jgi:hypothetical protein
MQEIYKAMKEEQQLHKTADQSSDEDWKKQVQLHVKSFCVSRLERKKLLIPVLWITSRGYSVEHSWTTSPPVP